MTTFLQNLLRRPNFADDEEKTRLAVLMHYGLLFSFPIDLGCLLYLLAIAPAQRFPIAIALMGLFCIAGCFLLVHKGYVHLAGNIAALCTWGSAAVLPWLGGTASDMPTFMIPVILVLAGVINGRRGLNFYLVLCIALWVSLLVADVNGRVAEFPLSINVVDFWVLRSFVFAFFIVVLYLSIWGLDQTANHLRRVNYALRESKLSKDYLDSIFQSMTEMLVVTNPDGVIRLVNEATLKTLGYEEAELIGQPINILFADRAPESSGFETLRRVGHIKQVERLYKTKSGESLPIILSGAVMKADSGEISGMVTVAQDISERKQFEHQQQKVKVLADIFRDISHDFRTPLSVINTSVHLLLRTDDPTRRQQRAEMIEKQTIRLSKLLDSLFTMVRLDSEMILRTDPLDMNRMVDEITREFQLSRHPEYREKMLNWVVVLTETPLEIRGDEAELRRALYAILENAVEYTPLNGTITVRTDSSANRARVEIRDSGIGIAADHLPHIFDRLYRADPARSPENGGSGLGLSIAQRVVELHGGSIHAASTPGQGSVFTISLPRG